MGREFFCGTGVAREDNAHRKTFQKVIICKLFLTIFLYTLGTEFLQWDFAIVVCIQLRKDLIPAAFHPQADILIRQSIKQTRKQFLYTILVTKIMRCSGISIKLLWKLSSKNILNSFLSIKLLPSLSSSIKSFLSSSWAASHSSDFIYKI